MASPRPSAVVRFREKIETSVTRLSAWSTANVPMMARMPTASGSSAATTLPNTTMSSRRVSGRAIDSALRKSDSTLVLTASLTIASPPAVTDSVPSSPDTCRASAAARSLATSSSPATRTSTSALSPPVLFSGGGLPSDQYETASATPGAEANRRVSACPAPTAAGVSTSPPSARTRSTRLGSPCWNCVSSTALAWDDSAPGSSNPPPTRFFATPPPNTPPAARAMAARTRTRRRRRTRMGARRESMAEPPQPGQKVNDVMLTTVK